MFWDSWSTGDKIAAISALIAAGGLALAMTKHRRRASRALLAAQRAAPPAPFAGVELLPCRWELDVTGEIGRVSIVLWAINYSSAVAFVGPTKVPYFKARGMAAIDPVVESDQLSLPARSVRQFVISRALIDAETRVVRETKQSGFGEADLTLSGAWKTGAEIGTASSGGPYAVLGQIRNVVP